MDDTSGSTAEEHRGSEAAALGPPEATDAAAATGPAEAPSPWAPDAEPTETTWSSATATSTSTVAGAPVPTAPRRGRSTWIVVVASVVVVALLLGGLALANRNNGAGPAPSGSSPGASIQPSVAPPTALEAKARAVPLGVTLTWSASADAVQGYRVFRGESQIATLPASATTYTDTAAQPGDTYTYGVTSRGSGTQESDPLSVLVEVPVPPLSKARLQGDFNVHVRVTDASGYTDYAKKFTIGWEFTPTCQEGPCDVRWKDLSDKDFRAKLKRSGARYRGSDSGPLNARCGETVVTSKLQIDFKVVKAKAIDGAWTATRIKGTVVQTEAAQLGCVSTRLDQAITGARLP